MTLYEDLAGARDATRRLLAHLDDLPVEQLCEPSLLPGWTRAQVVAHLAGNAQSHVRMLDGCLAGEVRTQYADENARAAAGGVRRPAPGPLAGPYRPAGSAALGVAQPGPCQSGLDASDLEEPVPYTGDVVVGGPADVRTAGDLQITKVATPPFENNCYLLRCTATGDTLLVDAAGDAPTLLELVGDGRLVGIVETHGHWDHVQALAEVKEASGAPVLVHPGDAAMLPVPADRLVADGDTIEVGSCTVTVISIEGHTPGSLALLFDADDCPHLFSGDSLFPGGPGRTTTPDEFGSLMDDLERKVFGPLPDETHVYPGHGNDTTLGVERPKIPEWRARGW